MSYRLPMGIRANLKSISARHVPGKNQQSVQQNNARRPQGPVQNNNLNRNIQNRPSSTQNPLQNTQASFGGLGNMPELTDRQLTLLNNGQTAIPVPQQQQEENLELLNSATQAIGFIQQQQNELQNVKQQLEAVRDDKGTISEELQQSIEKQRAVYANLDALEHWKTLIAEMNLEMPEGLNEILDRKGEIRRQINELEELERQIKDAQSEWSREREEQVKKIFAEVLQKNLDGSTYDDIQELVGNVKLNLPAVLSVLDPVASSVLGSTDSILDNDLKDVSKLQNVHVQLNTIWHIQNRKYIELQTAVMQSVNGIQEQEEDAFNELLQYVKDNGWETGNENTQIDLQNNQSSKANLRVGRQPSVITSETPTLQQYAWQVLQDWYDVVRMQDDVDQLTVIKAQLSDQSTLKQGLEGLKNVLGEESDDSSDISLNFGNQNPLSSQTSEGEDNQANVIITNKENNDNLPQTIQPNSPAQVADPVEGEKEAKEMKEIEETSKSKEIEKKKEDDVYSKGNSEDDDASPNQVEENDGNQANVIITNKENNENQLATIQSNPLAPTVNPVEGKQEAEKTNEIEEESQFQQIEKEKEDDVDSNKNCEDNHLSTSQTSEHKNNQSNRIVDENGDQIEIDENMDLS